MLNKKEKVVAWLEKHQYEDYTFNDDLSVNINGNVWITEEQAEKENSEIKLPIKFGSVSGNFICSHCGLTTLEGAPQCVGGYFNCGNNELTTLKGGPEYVEKNFYCSSNNLSSLEGCPKFIGGGLVASDNSITTLDFGPEEVGTLEINWAHIPSIGKCETEVREHLVGSHIETVSEFRKYDHDYFPDTHFLTVEFNSITRVNKEKRLLETQLAKLVEPYDREKEGPLPSEIAAKPKMKHKI
jgi:hypothetical protein